jgi:2-oxoglutarate dehydrogenase E2 component (dihydrolipoamide succinyltransferase)
MPIKTIEVPTMGDSITEGTIVDIPVEPGDYVQPDEVVLVLETDKVSVDVRASEGGALVEILGEIDDVVEVGTNLYRIDTDADPPESASTSAPMPETEDTLTPSSEAPQASQPVAAAPPPAAAAPPKPPPPPMAEAPVFVGQRSERRTKMSRMRQTVATRLKAAQNTAAMLTTFQECDMGNLMEMRKKYQDAFVAKHGIKLGFTSAFVLAATAALQEIPLINAYIDDEKKEIVYRDYCDISVAVASPKGLVTPILKTRN